MGYGSSTLGGPSFFRAINHLQRFFHWNSSNKWLTSQTTITLLWQPAPATSGIFLQTWLQADMHIANLQSTLAQSNLKFHQSAHFASQSREPEAQKLLQITKFDKLCTNNSKTKAGHESVKSPIIYHTAETRKANATTLLDNATDHVGLPLATRHHFYTSLGAINQFTRRTVEAILGIREQKTKQVGGPTAPSKTTCWSQYQHNQISTTLLYNPKGWVWQRHKANEATVRRRCSRYRISS